MTDGLLATDVSRFLRYLGVERQLSPITLLNYQRQLDAIMQIADEIGLKSWQQCDAATVRGFVVRSRNKNLRPASLALRLSALRSFFDWLVSQGGLTANPANGIATPPASATRAARFQPESYLSIGHHDFSGRPRSSTNGSQTPEPSSRTGRYTPKTNPKPGFR